MLRQLLFQKTELTSHDARRGVLRRNLVRKLDDSCSASVRLPVGAYVRAPWPEIDAIRKLNRRWLRGSEFHYPDRPKDLPELKRPKRSASRRDPDNG